MPASATIAERLTAGAAAIGGDTPADIAKAAARLDSFSRAPGTRKDADRIGAVLTPDVIRALGEAFVALREDELTGEGISVFGFDFRQADYAFAGLLIAAADPRLAEHAIPALERVRAMVARMEPKQAEHVQFVAGLYPDAPMSRELADAAGERLGQEPATLAAEWAAGIGLDLPAQYWSLHLAVPGEVEGGSVDALVTMTLDNTPGSETTWSIRIGAISANSLGGSRPPSYPDSDHGEYERTGRTMSGVLSVAGRIEPAAGPDDLPRVLRDLGAAHPEVDWDASAVKVSGTPGRLISPTKKKRLIAWLSERAS